MLTFKELFCYHGTTSSAVASIVKEGFKLSSSDEDWLGHGVYFFTDGVSDAYQNALEWSRNKTAYNQACVIKVKINIDSSKILDLTTSSGLRLFNIQRDKVIKYRYEELSKRRDINIKKRKDIRVDDCIVMGMILKELNYEAIIHNVYIKNLDQRQLALESSYPNSTVLCVNKLSAIEIADVLYSSDI